MKIYRDGNPIELTLSELREASDEYSLQCKMEDIKSEIAQNPNLPMITNFDDTDIQVIAERTEIMLSKNDLYYDAYWASINNAIEEYFEVTCREI